MNSDSAKKNHQRSGEKSNSNAVAVFLCRGIAVGLMVLLFLTTLALVMKTILLEQDINNQKDTLEDILRRLDELENGGGESRFLKEKSLLGRKLLAIDGSQQCPWPGDPGPRGEPGFPGRKGEPGYNGFTGIRGIDGKMGLKGNKGDIGLPGMSAPQLCQPGASGPRGLPGPSGVPGESGQRGLPGATGRKGERGLKADKGEIGSRGEQGFTGFTGRQGDTGALGNRGPRGPTGISGLPGASGQRGLPGATGSKGERGLKGDKGEIGSKGEQGYSGAPGPGGAPGVEGRMGERGLKGDQGEIGSKGERGETGNYTLLSEDGNVISTGTLRAIHLRGTGGDNKTGTASLGAFGNMNEWEIATDTDGFKLEADGNVTVSDKGQYYIYSKILFNDNKTFFAAETRINGEPYLKCSGQRAVAAQMFGSCTSNGIARLEAGDEVGIKSVYPYSFVDIRNEASYFGLIKLN